jgi:SAM-dependent methyltransferase
MNIRIEKTVALVVALAKLHNYCINANDNDISANTARDKWTSEINGAVMLSVHTTIALATRFPILDDCQELASHGSEEICNFDGCCCTKTSNWWLFNMEDLPGQWNGGIHFGYYANLIHYFTDPGDTVLDPCAGSGKLQATLDAHFAEAKEGWDFSGPRRALMYDLLPRYEGIQQADMRELAQAAGEGVADLIICDPPYYGIADGKYDNLGQGIGDWVLALHQSVQELAKVLKPGGHLALIVDDYLRSNEFQPLGMYCAQACHSAGLEPAAVVYGNSPHFVTSMNAMQMARAKKARLMCNQSKVVNVWRRPND